MTTAPRLAGWEQHLADYIAARANRKFRWGSNDCCLFAADAVLALTGVDPARELRTQYRSRADAEALLAARGGLEAVVTAALGEPLATPLCAQRGDVVLVVDGARSALGICLGAQVAGPGLHGLQTVPLTNGVAAWRVGL